MKKLFTLTILLICSMLAAAQKKSSKNQPSQPDMNKMMEEMMKQQGMSEKQKAEVRKAMGSFEEMQKKGVLNGNNTGTTPDIPKKQVKLLNSLPKIISQQQYTAYLNQLLGDCKKHIDPSLPAKVDKLIADNYNRKTALVNIAPVLFMQKNPGAAIYAAIKTAIANPAGIIFQNNLAVILHETGYPDKSIPILQFLVTKNKSPYLLNDLGQSYLSLGDTSNARKYFTLCLAKDPGNCDANCGMGLMLGELGKIKEAAPYIIQSLKNGYSKTAENLMDKYKLEIRFEDIRSKVPEYFNPQKFKPIPPATNSTKVEATETEWNELDALVQMQTRKYDAVMKADKEIEKKQEKNAESNPSRMMDLLNRGQGWFSDGPFTHKARLMMQLISQEQQEFYSKQQISTYKKKERQLYQELSDKINSMYKGNERYENMDEDCKRKKAFLDVYLRESANNFYDYQNRTLYKFYDWTNQSLYWQYFLQNEQQYKVTFDGIVGGFYKSMYDYYTLQPLHPTPIYIVSNCKNNATDSSRNGNDEDSLDINCPLNFKVDLVLTSYKLNCNGSEMEFLHFFGEETDFKTGEFNLLLGPDYEAEGLDILSGGLKTQLFFRFDENFTPIDFGMKFEGGVEAGFGTNIPDMAKGGISTEAKITATMSMSSGVNVTTNGAGQERTIFSYNDNPWL